MAGGRPATYGGDILTKARGYLTSFEDMGDPVPTIAGLACVLGVTRETCYAWASDPEKPEFSDITKELAQRQERALVANGLRGSFNAAVTKMLLAKHGYSDRVETDHTSSDGSMTPKGAIDLSKLSDQELATIKAVLSRD